MRQQVRTWRRGAALIVCLGALAGCGAGPEEAARDLRLTVTAAARAANATSGATAAGTPRAGGNTSAASGVVARTFTPGRAASAPAPVAAVATPIVGSIGTRPAVTVIAVNPRGPPPAAPAESGPGGGVARTPSAPGLYTDAGGRYSFRAPTKWRGQKSANSAVEIEVVSDTPAAYLRTASQTTTVPVTLDGAAAVITNSLRKSVGSFEEAPGGPREAMIGGQRAKRIEYYGTDSGTRLRYVTYIIVHNQKLVVSLFFIAQPGDLDEVLTQGTVVLNTFSFI